jgi:hypothetical protein
MTSWVRILLITTGVALGSLGVMFLMDKSTVVAVVVFGLSLVVIARAMLWIGGADD